MIGVALKLRIQKHLVKIPDGSRAASSSLTEELLANWAVPHLLEAWPCVGCLSGLRTPDSCSATPVVSVPPAGPAVPQSGWSFHTPAR
jgi:hypothetical protein